MIEVRLGPAIQEATKSWAGTLRLICLLAAATPLAGLIVLLALVARA